MNLCMDTGCGILPAPAWVSEIVRHAMGPGFMSVGRRPGPQQQSPTRAKGRDYKRDLGVRWGTPAARIAHNRDVERVEQQHAAARELTRNTGPMASATDVMVLWAKPWSGQGMPPSLTVVSHHGAFVMPPEVGARVAAEIQANNPGARVVILRDLHHLGGPRLDRSGDIPVLRYHAWP